MINLVLFPNFAAPASATERERRFLEELRNVRQRCGASFVNFSMFDYAKENPDAAHFVTYPMAWISQYARNYYSTIDPFNQIDFRRVAHIDWEDIYVDGPAERMFRQFNEAGIGRHALSLSIHAGQAHHGVASLVFLRTKEDWPGFKRARMEAWRYETNGLVSLYRELYLDDRPPRLRLTPRELEALRLVALGRTDERIALEMGIGRWTVVSHLQSAKFKLGCANRPAAVARAITAGLIDLRTPV